MYWSIASAFLVLGLALTVLSIGLLTGTITAPIRIRRGPTSGLFAGGTMIAVALWVVARGIRDRNRDVWNASLFVWTDRHVRVIEGLMLWKCPTETVRQIEFAEDERHGGLLFVAGAWRNVDGKTEESVTMRGVPCCMAVARELAAALTPGRAAVRRPHNLAPDGRAVFSREP